MARALDQFSGDIVRDADDNLIMMSKPLDAVRLVGGREVFRAQLQNVYSLGHLWADAAEEIEQEILEEVQGAIWRASFVFRLKAGVPAASRKVAGVLLKVLEKGRCETESRQLRLESNQKQRLVKATPGLFGYIIFL